jgi:NADH-quinone oxidoreductase subunit G
MPQITFTIDGKKVSCEKGTMVVQAALDAGIFIPHYCYHPALSVAGNCRMCMVEVVPKPPPNAPPGWKPPPAKPAIACATEAVEGMEVLSSRSAVATQAREGVLEFLLANHPLDCPVCDQAGECDLQDFSFQYGRATSKFHEDKEQKHNEDWGPEVRLYGNRCINCTRCVRFSQEISGGAEICQVNRGDRNVVDVGPGLSWDNPLSGNVVDICPVGALVSRDFLHKARVWQLDAAPSVCPHCATGCSIEVHTRDEEVQRLKPRHNPAVNGFWMCDAGRLGYKYVSGDNRLLRCEMRPAGTAKAGEKAPPREPVSFQEAAAAAGPALERAGRGAWALVSAWATNEEVFLASRMVPPERTALLARPSWEERRFRPNFSDMLRNPSLPGQQTRGVLYPDGSTFVIEADRNPNRRGAAAILGEAACAEGRLQAFIQAAEHGEVRAALVLGGMPGYEPPAALLAALEKVPLVVVCDILAGPLSERAHILFPGAAVFEKEGTFTNGRGTTQRFALARPTPGQARPELETLHVVAGKMHVKVPPCAPEDVFAALAAEVPAFKGKTWEAALHRSAAWSPHYAASPPAAPAAPGALLAQPAKV